MDSITDAASMNPLKLLLPSALVLLLSLPFAGCGPASEQKVSARSQDDYQRWFSQTSDKLPPDDARILQTAQQEIRLEIMAHSDAKGAEAIGDAFRQKVDGLTVRQMMALGLKDRIARLKAEHDEAQKLYDDNSKIQTKPGDEASAAYVSTRVQEDLHRAQKSAADLAATQADLDRINK